MGFKKNMWMVTTEIVLKSGTGFMSMYFTILIPHNLSKYVYIKYYVIKSIKNSCVTLPQLTISLYFKII